MRKPFYFAAVTLLGITGLAGWATIGSAQPGASPAVIEPLGDVPGLTPGSGDPQPLRPRTKPVAIPTLDPLALPEPTPRVAKPVEPVAPVRPVAPVSINVEPVAPVKIEPIATVKPTEPVKVDPVRYTDSAKTDAITIAADGPAPTKLGDSIMTARQDPAVTLEWIGPGAVKVGVPAEYTIAVRNICNIPVQKVIVQVRIPAGMNVLSSEPKAEGADNVLLWELGTLLSKQDKRLQLKLMAPTRGDLSCQAWVTFTGSSVMRMVVREPKLLVKVSAPDKVLVGDPANVVFTVSNPGDHPAEKVKIVADLSEGLQTVNGNRVTHELGTLNAGETRTFTVPCVTKNPGQQNCEAFTEADGGLKASDKTNINVIQPRIDLEVAGPKLRYLDRKGVYLFKVTNPGDAPASNVFVTDVLPPGLKFVSADNGGQHDYGTRSVKWFIGEIGPGQTREVKAELMATAEGDQTQKVSANASRGIKAEQDIRTVVEGIAAILMEVVDIEDPIEVGKETGYEIKVTNTGSKADGDIKLICSIPPQMRFKSATGPSKFNLVGNELVFDALPRLAPKADAVYKVIVTAAAKGDARFKVALTTTSLIEPVVKVESTKISDE